MDLKICSGATCMAAAAVSTVAICAPGDTISACRSCSRIKSAKSCAASFIFAFVGCSLSDFHCGPVVRSFPLYRAGGLAADVVDDPVHTLDLVGDPATQSGQD